MANTDAAVLTAQRLSGVPTSLPVRWVHLSYQEGLDRDEGKDPYSTPFDPDAVLMQDTIAEFLSDDNNGNSDKDEEEEDNNLNNNSYPLPRVYSSTGQDLSMIVRSLRLMRCGPVCHAFTQLSSNRHQFIGWADTRSNCLPPKYFCPAWT